MLSAIAYVYTLWFNTLPVCHAATIPASDGSLLSVEAPSINISLPSAPSIESPLLNATQIQCRGRQFGADLRYTSCLDAFHTFPYGDSDVPVEIGRRFTGRYVENLPWKWVSGIFSNDAPYYDSCLKSS